MEHYLKSTLRFNKYNIIGLILLLPFFTILSIDAASRIIQDDLFSYNRTVYGFLSHTPIYWFPVLFTWIVVFPLLAVVINVLPLVRQVVQKRTSLFSFEFVKSNIGTFLLLGIGLAFLAFIPLHDLAPCVLHGVLSKGIGEFISLLQYCRNA